MSGPSRSNNMRKSTAGFNRPSGAPRPSIGVANNPRAYLSAARSAATAPPASPALSVNSVSTARNRATSPTLKRKERDFDPREIDDGETNITVVVRCRGRSPREILENSAVVLSTPGGLRGREVVLGLGPSALNNKTYTFDRVFPPEADQTMVYDDVVQPILTEMLSGYNCTIFAYGQTGTGKTYTMSGDLTEKHGSYSDAAGIIPRVLYKLFNQLDTESAEYTVKCSFIELYNEDLRDLLSHDESIKVKIFEDSSKKGIVIQNMEETYIKNAEEGSKLLINGSKKREVAATKCNDLSSRSHTVFTITVHVKVQNDDGEDILKTGKLNLVDLAGSENVGRSGAENKRAREAGMINQSLLTLGRVINALVDRSQHVPYRESKLTRLLQDSLGGRTKTCIIATVSPAKVNLEETMSTLDYAARAKNIRNKPQINQLMTKKALIKEYIVEIERLKGDLAAARQKNGIFLTEESYKELSEENESRKIQVEELERKIEVLNIHKEKAAEELRMKLTLLNATKKELQEVKDMLDETKEVLEKTEQDLSTTKQNLVEETVLRKAHQKTESQLEQLSNGMIKTLGQTVSDVTKLHNKIGRKQELDAVNREVWLRSQSQVDDITQFVEAKIEEFSDEHTRLANDLSTKMANFVHAEVEKLTSTFELVHASIEKFNEKEVELLAETSQTKDDMNEVLEEIKILREQVKERVGEGLRGLNVAAERIAAEVIAELSAFQESLHASYSQRGREFKAMFDNTQKHMIAQKQESDRLRQQLATATAEAVTVNSVASATLDAILREEREQAAAERQSLIVQLTALINTTAHDQEQRLNQRITQVRGNIDTSREGLTDASTEFNLGMTAWMETEDKFVEELITNRESLKTKLVNDWTAAEEYSTNIQTTTQAIHAQTVKLVDEQINEVDVQMRALDEFVTRARTENENHHERFTNTFSALTQTAKQSYNTILTQMQDRKTELEEFGTDVATQTEELNSAMEPFVDAAQGPLKNLREQVAAAILQEYEPTGETPQKRSYEYPRKLPRTQSHEEILAQVRRNKERRGRFGFSPGPSAVPSTPSKSVYSRTFGGIAEGDNSVTDSAEGGSHREDVNMEEVGGELHLSPNAAIAVDTDNPAILPSPTSSSLSDNTATIPSTRADAAGLRLTGPSTTPPLVNSSINTHTFTHHTRRTPAATAKRVPAKGNTGGGLKELNPNVDVGTYRASSVSLDNDEDSGSLLDLQPPLKKVDLGKGLSAPAGEGKGLEKLIVEKKTRGGRGHIRVKDAGENSILPPTTRRRAAGN